MALSDRKKKILAAVVEEYIRTAEPVGSKTIAQTANLGCSSATIRNELSELVSMGYLEQPHTSAGRVPSPQGYRYYLDRLLGAPGATALAAEDKGRIDELFAAMDAEPEKLAQSAARSPQPPGRGPGARGRRQPFRPPPAPPC